MPVKSLKSLLVIQGLCLLSAAAWAAGPVDVSVKALPAKVTLGDEIRLLIQVERPKVFSVIPPSNKLDLSPFEIKRVETSPDRRGQNRVRETFVLTLTVFQLGDLKIPSVPVEYQDSSGRRKTLMTEPVAVKVVSVGRRVSDKDDIRTIKGPVAFGWMRWLGWFLAACALLLAAGLCVRLIRRRMKNAVDPESLKPPHERALLELGRLKEKDLLSHDNQKEFYSELADILRRYLERRFGVEAFECTTPEILSAMRKKTLDAGIIKKARQVFEQSDLVKFAKYLPPRSLADDLEAAIREIVRDDLKGAEGGRPQ